MPNFKLGGSHESVILPVKVEYENGNDPEYLPCEAIFTLQDGTEIIVHSGHVTIGLTLEELARAEREALKTQVAQIADKLEAAKRDFITRYNYDPIPFYGVREP